MKRQGPRIRRGTVKIAIFPLLPLALTWRSVMVKCPEELVAKVTGIPEMVVRGRWEKAQRHTTQIVITGLRPRFTFDFELSRRWRHHRACSVSAGRRGNEIPSAPTALSICFALWAGRSLFMASGVRPFTTCLPGPMLGEQIVATMVSVGTRKPAEAAGPSLRGIESRFQFQRISGPVHGTSSSF
jgi:hypothetical protein